MTNLSQKYMNFPSIRSVFSGASRSFLRFPLAMVLAVVATVFCIKRSHLHYDEGDAHFWYVNIAAAAYLGMMLSLALTVLAEKRQLKGIVAAAVQGGVLLLGAVYYFSLPDHYTAQAGMRFVLFVLGLHWLVACIAFVGRGEDNGFWLYNKRLFLRILTSGLYTGVLYLGLVIALSAIEHLFSIPVPNDLYTDIWFVLGGVFNTWFFLAGVPADYDSPKTITEYPKGLKLFTQLVLLPILTIYLLILYAYMIRIAVTSVWPYGWVSYMVLAFSVAGILAILLVWPLRDEKDNKWISGYSRFFYFALFPLIILLGFAIWKRVASYGITEQRYFVLVLAFWLLYVALYFLLSKRKTIRLIPLSLCVLAFVVSFGPWGAEGVSLRVQRSRLQALLEKNRLMADGRLTGRPVSVGFIDRREITGLTEYIVRSHGYKALQSWFAADLDSLIGNARRSSYTALDDQFRARVLLKEMKVEYANSYDSEYDEIPEFYADVARDKAEAIVTTGYDYYIGNLYLNIATPPEGIDTSRYRLGKYELIVQMDTAANQLELMPGKDSVLKLDLSGMVARIPSYNEGQTTQLTEDKLTITKENSQWGCRLTIIRCNGVVQKGNKRLKDLSGYLLMKRK